MSDQLTKATCRICGQDVYFFISSENPDVSLELTCRNGHSDTYSNSTNIEIDAKPNGKLARIEAAAAAS